MSFHAWLDSIGGVGSGEGMQQLLPRHIAEMLHSSLRLLLARIVVIRHTSVSAVQLYHGMRSIIHTDNCTRAATCNCDVT